MHIMSCSYILIIISGTAKPKLSFSIVHGIMQHHAICLLEVTSYCTRNWCKGENGIRESFNGIFQVQRVGQTVGVSDQT